MILKYLMAVFLLLTFVQAEEHHEKHYHHYYSKDLTYLKLSVTQEEKMKTIIKDYRHNVKNFRKIRKDISDEKQALFLNDIFDEKKLKEINQKICDKAFDVKVIFLKQVHEILTPKQRKEFAKYSDAWDIE